MRLNLGIKTAFWKMGRQFRAEAYRVTHPRKEKFTCPICRYRGPFRDDVWPTSVRLNAGCPSCRSVERHRMMWLALDQLSRTRDFSRLSLIHFSPDGLISSQLRKNFASYETADLTAAWADHRVDLRSLPFPDKSYDAVIACHVLEHIKEDSLAIVEVKRILRPGGFAILQVPVHGGTTVEYDRPNPDEFDHVRSPGLDYFGRYEAVFPRVETFSSSQFAPEYQPYLLFKRCPSSAPDKNEDIVPICYS